MIPDPPSDPNGLPSPETAQPAALASPPPRRTPALESTVVLALASCLVLTLAAACLGIFQIGRSAVKAAATQRRARAVETATVLAREAQVTATFQAIQASATARALWPVVLLDPFDSNETRWKTGVTGNETVLLQRIVSGGVYRWEAEMKAESFAELTTLDTHPLSAFSMAVTIRPISGPASTNAGVVFRVDDDGYYFFAVEEDGFFSFWLLDSGNLTPVIDWVQSPFIDSEGSNRIEVSVADNHFLFTINGHLVAEITEGRRGSGLVGVMMQGYEPGETSVYEFDDFELRAP